MAEPTKTEIQAIFKRLRSIQTNKQCFDCAAKNPTWASVTYGVFLCIDCSAVHRALGVHVTFIRSTQLDVFTWLQLRAMQIGGNASAMAFFRQHGVETNDAHRKYTSRAAGLYKEKVNKLAVAAARKYGTDLHIHDIVQSPKVKEVDFFKEHTDDVQLTSSAVTPAKEPFLEVELTSESDSRPVPIKNGNGNKKVVEDPTIGPSVEAALSISPTAAMTKTQTRKPTIGQRKPQSAKKGLGTRKGLGAQKVKANFAEMESAALQAEKIKVESAKQKEIQVAKTKEEEAAQMASMRLAYQDMSVELKKQEEKMKAADPTKAKQMERLGMGFGGRSAISHSAMSDMTVIEQVSPVKEQSKSNSRSSNRDFFEDFERGNSHGSSNSRYKVEEEEDDFFSSYGSKKSTNISTSKQSSYDSIAPLDDSRSRAKAKKDYSSSTSPAGSDAQKRFGTSKSISSEQYFGKKDEMDNETRANLERYSGSGSISSDQLFGRSSDTSSGSATDMGAIKDGMKEGVTQVAGKLSRMANGLYSSIQDRYGY